MFDIIIRILEGEIEFYKNRSNEDWSHDKNEGFKVGIKYCKDLVEKVKQKESTR